MKAHTFFNHLTLTGLAVAAVAMLMLAVMAACGSGGCPPNSHDYNGRCVCDIGFKQDVYGDCVPVTSTDGDEEPALDGDENPGEESDTGDDETAEDADNGEGTGDVDNSEGGESDIVVPEGVYYDTGRGLMWQITPDPTYYAQYNAEEHCANLTIGDLDDWYLPDISQLRSLLVGCDKTDLGGQCNIDVAGCTESSCRSGNCDGCSRTDTCYWHTFWQGECSYFWSSTPNEGSGYWYINFENGRLNVTLPNVGTYLARCVRDVTER